MRTRPIFSAKNYAGFLLAIFFGLFSSLAIANSQDQIIFVNINNSSPIQDGASWKTAFSSLESALDEAAMLPKSQIWVAAGTYVPTEIYAPNGVPGGAFGVASPNLATFNLPNNVSIFGGFEGHENSIKERKLEKCRTILSGNGFSWHVVIAGNDVAKTGVAARLDGLTITQGNAQGPGSGNALFAPFGFEHSSGAGLYAIFGSNIAVENLIFSYNISGAGSGLGGAVLASNTNIHINKSHFEFNTAADNGGGVQILDSFSAVAHKSLIENSKFNQNSAGLFGGAVVGEGAMGAPESRLEIKNCDFEDNKTMVGGAIAVDSLRVDIQESRFKRNVASVAGGALSTTNVVNTIVFGLAQDPLIPFPPFTTTVCNCDFSNNEAQGNLADHNTLFGGPAASGIFFPLGGGAIAVYINGYLDLESSKFSNNRAVNF